MAGSRTVKRGSFFVFLYLILLVCFFIPFVSAMVIAVRDTAVYGVEYDKDPLILKEVEVICLGDSYREYEISEGNMIYEVILTYENTGWYTAEYGNTPDFSGIYNNGEDEEYIGSAWLNTDAELYYEAIDENPIPAGKTGCRRYYVEIWPYIENLKMIETGSKLNGKRMEVELTLPDSAGESISMTLNENLLVTE